MLKQDIFRLCECAICGENFSLNYRLDHKTHKRYEKDIFSKINLFKIYICIYIYLKL